MTKRLLIVGAGDAGREIFSWAKNIKSHEWELGGFIDDNLHALDGYRIQAKIISKVSSYIPEENDLLACGIFTPRIKLALCKVLQSKGARFITLIHPSAVILENSHIGVGCVLFPNTYVSNQAILNDFVCLNVSAGVGHDAIIGEGCTLNSHCALTGKVKLADGVMVGTNATILPKVSVGEHAIVGAGSVVIKNVKANTTVMGVPAKELPEMKWVSENKEICV